MKIRLQITKNDASLYMGVHDVADAESFGKACADAWWKMKQQRLDKDSSIGALMEHLDDSVINQLNGARITVEQA